jgi:hypothetical protein
VNPYGLCAGVNHNAHLTRPLALLLEAQPYLTSDAPTARIKAKQLEAAVGALAHLCFRVTSVDQLHALPGFGPSTLEKVGEILTTGKLARSERVTRDARLQTLMQLDGLLWVGPAQARRLWDAGVRSVADLAAPAGQALLSRQQRLGVAYHDELAVRSPRWECAQVESYVRRVAQTVVPGCLCAMGGSYRRGQPTSADYDLILATPEGYGECDLLPELVRHLRADGFLTGERHPRSAAGAGGGVHRHRSRRVGAGARRAGVAAVGGGRQSRGGNLPLAILSHPRPHPARATRRRPHGDVDVDGQGDGAAGGRPPARRRRVVLHVPGTLCVAAGRQPPPRAPPRGPQVLCGGRVVVCASGVDR